MHRHFGLSPEYLGVSKGYVSQLMSMEYDHRLSKLVELSLAFGFTPEIDFKRIPS